MRDLGKAMSNGPCLIFDKSTLQALSLDEAVWLDQFFLCNITPIFYMETLADLEKQVSRGRTPEDVVGGLAFKTPDAGSRPNVHHYTLAFSELAGNGPVVMDGRPVVSGGQDVVLDGEAGVLFRDAPEEDAFRRWHRHEFLDLERLTAKQWRRALAPSPWLRWMPEVPKPKTLSDLREMVSRLLDRQAQEAVLGDGMALLGIPDEAQALVCQRWHALERPRLETFAPYFRFVFSVALFSHLAMAADLISRDRPSHKIDLAYLYYLPFCNIFASSDKLHAATVPLFLRPDQAFVQGSDLKADLRLLDQHYSSLPEDVRERGLFGFASRPPIDGHSLTSSLWDRYRPGWRRGEENLASRLDDHQGKSFVEKVMRYAQEATPASHPIGAPEPDTMVLTRQVYPRKGKWHRFPPEVEAAHCGPSRKP